MNKKIYINELEVGKNICCEFMVKECSISTTKNSQMYLNITLCDRTGSINAKMWNYENNFDLEKIKFVEVSMKIDEYNGHKQGIINKLKIIEQPTNVEDFIPVAPENKNELFLELTNDYVSKLAEPYKKIIETAIEQLYSKFLFSAAGKNVHHNYQCGLLHHIVGMLRIAKGIVENYAYLNIINKDLLYAGIILHDLAKISEYKIDEFGLYEDFSLKGHLLGHLYMGAAFIRKICCDLSVSQEISILLEHMVLSHHGKLEYGSPVTPKFLEANLLHQIDMIDANINTYWKEYNDMDDGEVKKNFVLGTIIKI